MKRSNGPTGSIIIPMVVALGLTVFAISYYYTQYFFLKKLDEYRLIYSQNFKIHAESVRGLLRNQGSIVQTLSHPLNNDGTAGPTGDLYKCATDSTYNCFTNHPQGVYTKLALINEDGTVFSDSHTAEGFAIDFSRCTTFPSAGCSMRYELTWYTECAVSPCYLPNIYLVGGLMTLEVVGRHIALNAANYKTVLKVK